MGAWFSRAMGVRNFRFLAGLLLAVNCCTLWAAESQSKAVRGWSVQWKPSQLVNGSPVLFQVKPALPLKTLSGKWLEHNISFVLDPKTKIWNAIAGIALDTKPGIYTLFLTAGTPTGKDVSFQRRLSVRKG